MKKGKKIKELEEWLNNAKDAEFDDNSDCLLYTSPSPRD